MSFMFGVIGAATVAAVVWPSVLTGALLILAGWVAPWLVR
jgi:hypothetical protein